MSKNGHRAARNMATQTIERIDGKDAKRGPYRTLTSPSFKLATTVPFRGLEQATPACAQADPNLFDPHTESELAAARDICAVCPIAPECLSIGFKRGEWGVWGGVLLEEGRVRETPPRNRDPYRRKNNKTA